jgi:hypothetical protein
MTFNDLKQLNGQMIQYYEVCGNKVTPRTAKVRYNGYGNSLVLMKYDKLGRQTGYDTIIHLSYFILPNGITTPSPRNTTKLVGESSMVRNHWYYRGRADICIYLQKEDAYNIVINRLREERRNVDKKMLALQKELYKK